MLLAIPGSPHRNPAAMVYERPPLRLLRVLVITALLLAAIVTLVPEEPPRTPDSPPGKALAVSEPAKAVR